MERRVVIEAAHLTMAYLNQYRDCGDAEILATVSLLSGLNPAEIPHMPQQEPFAYEETQRKLERINELSGSRRERGVYYTPRDVVDFTVMNAINSFFHQGGDWKAGNRLHRDIPEDQLSFDLTIYDPTCGLSEFLRSALALKLSVISPSPRALSKGAVERILGTLRGNDSDPASVAISKLRIFIDCVEAFGLEMALSVARSVDRMFTLGDAVVAAPNAGVKIDIVVGNPPYVEDNRYAGEIPNKYGNVYCNVVSNAMTVSPQVVAFILPISYVATARMARIRDEVSRKMGTQAVLTFADRPDSLFNRVHQKLCILFAGHSGPTLTTSNYRFWYRNERDQLFSQIETLPNPFGHLATVPKLGTQMDLDIFKLLMDEKLVEVYAETRKGAHTVTVNRRETFWMKVFRESRNHPEFKEFHADTKATADFIYCLLNSSLFWWYWIAVSDCWHVSRNLNGFRMPKNVDTTVFGDFAKALEERLETTKKYVGTKQTAYEYKHAACLAEIWAIDDAICRIYGLSSEQAEYVKTFAIEYRTGKKIERQK